MLYNKITNYFLYFCFYTIKPEQIRKKSIKKKKTIKYGIYKYTN